MFSSVVALAAHQKQIAEKGSLSDLAHRQQNQSFQQQNRKSSRSLTPKDSKNRPITPYKYINRKLKILFEPSFKCCSLWDEREYTCPIHPRHPPHEYYMEKFTAASIYLEQAYRVDLWLFQKRYDRALRALHSERHEKLGLADVPTEQDFPKVQPRSREDKKRLIGNMCIVHTIKINQDLEHHWSSKCFICNYNQVRKRHVEERQQIYLDYCDKISRALRKVNRDMGHKLFESSPPPVDPGKAVSSGGTRCVLHITDWCENHKGKNGNYSSKARYEAEKMEKKKTAIWKRMGGEPVTKGYALEPIAEED